MNKKFIFPFLILSALFSRAQVPDYAFVFHDSIPLTCSAGDTLPNAWQGGVNFCQYNSIDLNLDGISDLILFDRSGNRLSTFLNTGSTNPVFHYDPAYIPLFPAMHDWVLTRDYDGDGKMDLFTYSSGGTSVYRNVSTVSSGLKFQLVTYILNSWQGGSQPINLYINSVDIPAISDIDKDGDLDILTFGPLGAYVQFHRNRSWELYGNADSLDFTLEENCWGDFSESATSNTLTLNITCPLFTEANEPKGPKHTGSTMLALDLDGDHDDDLIMGDVSYSNLVAVTNGGDTTNAHAVSQDTLFPVYNTSVDISSFPAAFYMDLNNDGKRDLVVAPNDQLVSENNCTAWYYRNDGTDDTPLFSLQTKHFQKNEILDFGEGAYPVLFNHDGDSLTDLVVSDYGYWLYSWDSIGNVYSKYRSQLALLKNTGTKSHPVFCLADTNYANLSSLGITAAFPAFGDLDDDGAAEMVVGNNDGRLYFFENTAGAGNPAAFTLSQSFWMGIDVGRYSAPQLIDIDRDGLLELICGERSGKLFYFDNTGTASSPMFSSSPTSSNFGGVNVTDYSISNYGYSTPCFFDDNGDYRLFCGSYSGHIYYYKNIEGNLGGNFTRVDTNYCGIHDGVRIGLAVGNINEDSYPDLFIGNYAGGIRFFKGIQPVVGISETTHAKPPVAIFPNPATESVNISLSDNIRSPFHILILNVHGSIVYNGTLDQNATTLPVHDWSPGMYFVRLENNQFAVTGRFAVIH